MRPRASISASAASTPRPARAEQPRRALGVAEPHVDARRALELAAALEQLGGRALVAQGEQRLAGLAPARPRPGSSARPRRGDPFLCRPSRRAPAAWPQSSARASFAFAPAFSYSGDARARTAGARAAGRRRCSNSPRATSFCTSASRARRRGFARAARRRTSQASVSPPPSPTSAPVASGCSLTESARARSERSSARLARTSNTHLSLASPALTRVAAPSAFSARGNSVLRARLRPAGAYPGAMARALDPVHRELARFLRAQGVARTTPRCWPPCRAARTPWRSCTRCSRSGQRVGVAHVHHGLRGAEAERELEFVARAAHTARCPVPRRARRRARRDGRSPEARARALRYAALERMRVAGGYASLVTAHQRDDQAETVLLRALRGTGPARARGDPASLDGGRVLRPLLGAAPRGAARVSRAARAAFVPTRATRDRAIPRNRLRAEVLPVLEAIAPGAVSRLAALAELARAAEDAGARGARRAARARGSSAGEGGLWLESRRSRARARAAAPRCSLARAPGPAAASALTRVQLERIDAFLRSARAGQRLALAGGHALYRDRARVWLGPGPRAALPGARRALARAAASRSNFPRDASVSRGATRRRPAPHPDPHPPARAPGASAARCAAPRRATRSTCGAGAAAQGRARRRPMVEAGASASAGGRRRGRDLWVPGLVRERRCRTSARARGCEIRAVRLSTPARTC